MKIVKAAHIGYCRGVVRALDIAKDAAAERGFIETLGPLIHNQRALDDFTGSVSSVPDVDAVQGEAVLIRAHGMGPEVYQTARERGLTVIDATCPMVAQVQRLAESLNDQGYQVIVVGDAGHAEVKGICGWTHDGAIVVRDAAEAVALPPFSRAALIAQTTEREDNFLACAEALKSRCDELLIRDTICGHTRSLQQATAQLARQVEAMVVIGGRNSSNTAKLAQISAEANIPVYHIEDAAEVDIDIVRSRRLIGLTAGASTPEHIIEEVVERMTELEKMENEGAEILAQETAIQAEEAAEEDAVEAAQAAEAEVKEAVEHAFEPDAPDQYHPSPEAELEEPSPQAEEEVALHDMDEDIPAEEAPVEEAPVEEIPVEEAIGEAPVEETPAEEAVEEAPAEEAAEEAQSEEAQEKSEADAFTQEYGDMKEIRRGARVKGVVVQVKDDELLVDIGGKSEGVLTASELSNEDAKNIHERFHIGDEIDVLILRKENQEGYPVLSKRRVDQDIAWDRLAQLKQDKTVVSGMVTDVVKGGVLVDVGIRGFVPASLVALGYVEDLSTYLGKELQMKIIECDKHSNKLVLSAKAVLRRASQAQKEQTWAEVAEGQTLKGVVRRLTSFGAFVDIGGVDGLLHVSEMAWYRVNHPADLLKEGDEIEVYILGVDRENEKISLGMKQLIANPWTEASEKYPEGSIIPAKVMRTTDFGAFLEVEPGVEGLVHISQMANHRVEKTEDVVKPGDMVEVKVISVDPEAKRMSLSIKATLPPEEEDPMFPADEEAPVEEAPVEEAPVEEAAVEEAPVEEAPVEEAPVEEAPVEEAAVEEAPVEEAPAEEAPVEEAPVEEAPAEETPAEEAAAEETPAEEAPVEEAAEEN